MKKLGICFMILFFVLIVGCEKKTSSQEKLLFGNWNCESSKKLILKNNKSFENYITNDKNNFYVKGTYIIDDVKLENDIQKYVIIMNATERIIYGNTYTNEYTTKYEIAMDLSDTDHFIMMNTVSSSIDICEREY